MALPDDKVDEIRSTVDIVDVVSDYVRLKRSGQSYKGLCPFHDENTPSFHVNPEDNLYYCFGCQKGGDVFSFVQEMEGVGFVESARWLAERTGVSLPQSEAEEEAASHREAIYQALRIAGRFFYRQRTQSERGAPARRYLSERDFDADTLKTFGVGYAPDSWDALLTAAQEEHLKPEILHDAGLIIERNAGDGYYDRYRGRVIFPIFSHIGKVVGFAGRILDADADQPKYINSPETEVYHKSDVLYGLYQGKQAIRREKEVWVVEGYTDVMALHQAGIEHAVATCGTALTPSHVQMLDRYAQRVILLFDGDEAGGRAARSGLKTVLSEGLGAYAVTLPAGHDPDSYVKEHGADALHQHVANTRSDLPQFMVNQAREAGRMQTPEDRVEVQSEVVAAVAAIPDANLRREYVRQAADVLDVPPGDLLADLERQREAQQKKQRRRSQRSRPSPPPPPQDNAPPNASPRTPQPGENGSDERETDRSYRVLPEERLLLRLLLEKGGRMIQYVLSHMALDEFSEGPVRKLVQCLMQMYKDGSVQPDRILRGEEGPVLQQLAASVRVDEYSPSENWEHRRDIRVPRLNERPYEAAASAMTLLKLDRVDDALREARADIRRADRNGADDLTELQNRLMKLTNLRKHIHNRDYLNDPPTG
ncbi:DNA primase [Longimonas halophila]|uniref:DNA primase n=1 Tax=Longimonas halophila TaxID=1469170 RepID=A0A2H3NX48_9BACT|nr:DNA primase [Longimonas halophila]PEN06697.1 DNA primase [Longimonas halophila]